MKLTVAPGTDIVYIIGSVNGVDREWVAQGAGRWSTDVERSSDNAYHVVVTGWDGAGNSKTYDTTLYYGIWLVTDRTQQDVDRAEALRRRGWESLTARERAEWLAGFKGAYNATDLTRVESAVKFLSDLLAEYGYAIPAETRIPWAPADVPTDTEMSRYLGNVRSLRDSYAHWIEDITLPDSMAYLTFEGANNIERLLLEIFYYIQQMTAAWLLCGEPVCGEV
jgi:hypothetical protein